MPSHYAMDTVEKLDLPKKGDQDIRKDEVIVFTGKKALDTGRGQIKLCLVGIYKQDENKVIEIITNCLDWSAWTIADLYKKRWDIELFFKTIKQKLQSKTFVGTSENAVRSKIYIALITYLRLQFREGTIAKKSRAFSNFLEKIRMCPYFYLILDYACNHVGEGATKVTGQIKLNFDVGRNLFSVTSWFYRRKSGNERGFF